MEIDDKLVEVFCELDCQVAKSVVLELIESDDDWPLLQVSALEDVLEGVEHSVASSLAVLVSTDIGSEEVGSIVSAALSLEEGISAAVLIVWHWRSCSHITAKLVFSFDSDVDECFCVFQEILAEEIASIVCPSISSELTVSVLNRVDCT